MISTRRMLQVYWGGVFLVLVILAWWVVFFWHQGDYLTARIARSGETLSEAEQAAVRAAARETLRMFVFEGVFLVLLLVGGVWLIVRSMSRELAAQRQHKDFLSAVTHELRSPLASARLYVESVLLGRATGEKQQGYLKRTLVDLDRLNERVDALLSAGRLRRSEPEVEPQDMDLALHVQRCVEQFRQGGLAPGARLDCIVEESAMAVADPQAVSSIVSNLVSNALKYGGEPPHVEVRVERRARHVELSVRDWGPGLRGADAQSIFAPFVRGKDEDVRMRPGTGLGLYLVAELARALGGDVRAEDHGAKREAGGGEGGLCIRVRLPLSTGGAA